jgi:hypothetical protein
MRNIRLNGWERIGVCATVVYLIILHVFVFTDAKSPPTRTTFDPAKIRASTLFHDWGVSHSPAISPEEFRKQRHLPEDYVMTEADLLEGLPDQWNHSLRLRPYLFWLLVPPVLAWGFGYLAVSATKWIGRGFRS